MFTPLTDWLKKILSDDLESVRLSQRLVNDPCVIVSSEYGYSPNMERISKAQAYSHSEKAQNPYANSKRVLELNPSHPAIKELFERVKDTPDDETKELATLLYEGALINSGYNLKEPVEFSKRFYRLFNGALGIDKDAKVEDIEVDLTEEDVEEEKPKSSENSAEESADLDEEFAKPSSPRTEEL